MPGTAVLQQEVLPAQTRCSHEPAPWPVESRLDASACSATLSVGGLWKPGHLAAFAVPVPPASGSAPAQARRLRTPKSYEVAAGDLVSRVFSGPSESCRLLPCRSHQQRCPGAWSRPSPMKAWPWWSWSRGICPWRRYGLAGTFGLWQVPSGAGPASLLLLHMPSDGSPSRGSVNVSLAVPAVAFEQVPEGRVLGVDAVTVDAGASVRDEIDEAVVDDHAERLGEGVRFLRWSCPATARVNGGSCRPGLGAAGLCMPTSAQVRSSSHLPATCGRRRRQVVSGASSPLRAAGFSWRPVGGAGASRLRSLTTSDRYRNPVFGAVADPEVRGVCGQPLSTRSSPIRPNSVGGGSPLDGEPSPGRMPSAGTWNLRVGRSLLRRPGDHGRRCTLCSNSSTSATAATWSGSARRISTLSQLPWPRRSRRAGSRPPLGRAGSAGE